MNPAPALIAFVALLLGGYGLREFLLDADESSGEGGRKKRKAGEPVDLLGLKDRIRRAGLPDAVTPRTVLLGKGLLAVLSLLLGSLFTTVLPGRLAPMVLAGVAVGGFILPDFLLERKARRRHRDMVLALPDVLDLLAVSVQTGRGLGGCLLDLASTGRGPLVEEMSRAGDDMAWGSGQAAALEDLRRRVGGPEITAFVTALERSRRLGSPIADQLRRQSASLRQDQRRAIEEQAARAAPKIQLVIAMVLVPSVLLLIVAALVANADNLINVGY